MLQLLQELIFDYTLRNVALGSAILGITGGVLGCFAVLRRQGLFGDGLAHATFPGVCLAFLIVRDTILPALLAGAAVTALAGALLITGVVSWTRIKQDAILGIVLSVFFGFGIVLLSYINEVGGSAQGGLEEFIFGQAATIIREDVNTMAVLAAVALLTVGLLYKEFKLLSFDPEFAASMGYPVGKLNVLLVSLMVVAIIIGIQTVGVILMAAMLITPAAAARQWTDRLSAMLCISGLFGALSGVVGALISATGANLPTGPLVVLAATAIFLVSLLAGARQGLLWGWLRGRRNRRQALAGAAAGAEPRREGTT